MRLESSLAGHAEVFYSVICTSRWHEPHRVIVRGLCDSAYHSTCHVVGMEYTVTVIIIVITDRVI